jgi:hypothetical protein
VRIEYLLFKKKPEIGTVVFQPTDDLKFIKAIVRLLRRKFAKLPAEVPGASLGENVATIEEIWDLLKRTRDEKEKLSWPRFPSILFDLHKKRHVKAIAEVREFAVIRKVIIDETMPKH